MRRTGLVLFGAAMLACGPVLAADPAPCAGSSAPPALAALVQRMAAQPLHYGGDISGTLPARAGTGDAAGAPNPVPAHLMLAVGYADGQGRLAGDALVMDPTRHLVDTATVSGQVQPGPAGQCRLLLQFTDGETATVDGTCTPQLLSGALALSPRRPGWITRTLTWWNDRELPGRVWMDRDSFASPFETMPASCAAPAPV
jgi:hypothetical protein